MDDSLKSLRSELRLNETQMKGAGNSTELLKKRQNLLKNELSAAREKTVLLNNKLEEAKKILGNNSTETQNLSRKLNEAKNVEAAIQNEIAQTNEKIKEQEKANSALEQSIQKADSKLSQLNQELELNETQLQGTSNKTELLKQRQELLGTQSKVAADKVNNLEKALEACGNEVGENSDEYANLKSKLTEAKTEQAAIQNGIRTTTNELKEQKTQLQAVGDAAGKFGDNLNKAADKTKGLSTVATGTLAAAGTAAVTFESAFAGVKKTVDEVYDANGKCVYSYEQLETGIRQMAKEIPSSTTEISAVAEAAGQLGIETENVLGFTRTMLDLGNSTNLSAEEAATALAKFANVTNMSQKDFDRLGSTIVDLGNNFATTESDVVNMATRLSGAGTQIGLTEGEIMGFSTALSSVGMEAEAGGSAFSKAMVKMQVACETGLGPVQEISNKTGLSLRDLQMMSANSGKEFTELAGSLGLTRDELKNMVDAGSDLQGFADIAGMTSEQFKRAFEEDAAGALESFIKGLGDTEGKGESTIAMLEDLGFTETRLRDAMTRLANSGELVENAVSMGNTAWDENKALTEEANKRYETTASRLGIMKNHLNEAAITLGSVFLPMISGGAEKISGFADKIAGLDERTQKIILGVVTFAALLSPMLKGLSGVSKGISTVIGVGTKLAGMFSGISAAMSAPILPILGVIAAIAAVIAIVVVLVKNWDTVKEKGVELWNKLQEVWNGIKETISTVIENIKTVVSEKFNAIKETITTIFTTVKDTLSTIWETIKNVIQVAIMFIGEILTVAFEIITLPWRFIWENCKEYIFAAWDAIKSVISNALDAIKTTISNVWNTIVAFLSPVLEGIKATFTNIWNAIKAVISSVMNTISSIIGSAWDGIKSIITNVMNTISSVISNILSGIKSAFSGVWNSVTSTVSNALSVVQSTISGGLNAAQSIVSNVLESIKTKFSSIFESAKNIVKNAIDTIKGFFNFSWKLPHIDLPHFSISGSFSLKPPSVPHFNVDWYKNGAIFSKPTIFNTAAGFKGVGEAGPEAVAPISDLMVYFDSAMNRFFERINFTRELTIDYDKLAAELSKQTIVGQVNKRELFRLYREFENGYLL